MGGLVGTDDQRPMWVTNYSKSVVISAKTRVRLPEGVFGIAPPMLKSVNDLLAVSNDWLV